MDQQARMKQLSDESTRFMDLLSYDVHQRNGQRHTTLRNVAQPEVKYEVFLGKLPRDMFERDLFPHLRKAGRIYKLRIMVDFSGTTRGFGFVEYFTQQEAEFAVQHLNGSIIREGSAPIGLKFSYDNSRLYFGNLPPNITRETLLRELNQQVLDVEDAELHETASELDGTKFAYVTFKSHDAATKARRVLVPGEVKLFDRIVTVDWAKPQRSQVDSPLPQAAGRSLEFQLSESLMDLSIESSANSTTTKAPLDASSVSATAPIIFQQQSFSESSFCYSSASGGRFPNSIDNSPTSSSSTTNQSDGSPDLNNNQNHSPLFASPATTSGAARWPTNNNRGSMSAGGIAFGMVAGGVERSINQQQLPAIDILGDAAKELLNSVGDYDHEASLSPPPLIQFNNNNNFHQQQQASSSSSRNPFTIIRSNQHYFNERAAGNQLLINRRAAESHYTQPEPFKPSFGPPMPPSECLVTISNINFELFSSNQALQNIFQFGNQLRIVYLIKSGPNSITIAYGSKVQADIALKILNQKDCFARMAQPGKDLQAYIGEIRLLI